MRRRSPFFLLALLWGSLWGVSASPAGRLAPRGPASGGSAVDDQASALLAQAIVSAGWNGADLSTLRDPQPHRRARLGFGPASGSPTFSLHTLLPAQAFVARVGFQLRHSHALARRVAAGQTALPPPVV